MSEKQGTEYTPGQPIIWHHEMRGGYAFVERIPGVVTAIGEKRIRIAVQLRSGETVQRWVRADNLEARRP